VREREEGGEGKARERREKAREDRDVQSWTK